MAQLLDFFLHLDKHLSGLIAWAGHWSYLVIFLVIFCETGLVVTPFLPGDSLLFAVGSLAGLEYLDIRLVCVSFTLAAFAGNTTNYLIGRHLGLPFVEGPLKRIVDHHHIERAHAFFQKYGRGAVILSRFAPILRTFVPFVAGVSKMDFRSFMLSNAVGALLWTNTFLLAGYLFGNIPQVKQHFSLIVIGVIVVSFIPFAVEVWKARRGNA